MASWLQIWHLPFFRVRIYRSFRFILSMAILFESIRVCLRHQKHTQSQQFSSELKNDRLQFIISVLWVHYQADSFLHSNKVTATQKICCVKSTRFGHCRNQQRRENSSTLTVQVASLCICKNNVDQLILSWF